MTLSTIYYFFDFASKLPHNHSIPKDYNQL